MSKPLIWWYAFGEYKKLSLSANSTHSSTEWGQDIKTTQNKTSERLFGTKINSKNCNPLAFPNNYTTFASEYITNLSSLLAPCPLSTRLGAFLLPPKHFPTNFFRNFFHPRAGWLFAVFLVRKIMALSKWLFFISLVRKIMGVKGACRSANGGGCPLLHTLYISNKAFIRSCSRLLRHTTRTKRHRIRAKRGKSKHLFACFCLTLVISETRNGKI